MQLDAQKHIAEGSQRLVFKHPENPNLCLKVAKQHSNERYVNREIKYTLKYQNKTPHIPHYHGTIETNLGTGYIFDLVTDYDGKLSQTLKSALHTTIKQPGDIEHLKTKNTKTLSRAC